MSKSAPYQPIVLRVLHGLSAVMTIGALMTGFWIYDVYDGRWGGLSLPRLPNLQDIHGKVAVIVLCLLPLLVIYSFQVGYRRLFQSQSFSSLAKVGEPQGWIALHRLINTVILLAITFAVMTGRMMHESWLPAQELNHGWYLAHLASWVTVFVSLAIHLLMGAKVGGVPLLASMLRWQVRDQDRPQTWFKDRKIKTLDSTLKIFEGIILLGIFFAFVLPIFHYI